MTKTELLRNYFKTKGYNVIMYTISKPPSIYELDGFPVLYNGD